MIQYPSVDVNIIILLRGAKYKMRIYGVVDTLPSGQCVSLSLELISTTYQHKYYDEDTTKRLVCINEGCPPAGSRVVPLFSPARRKSVNWCMLPQ